MTASELAKLCGVSRSRVSRWIAAGLPTRGRTASGCKAAIDLRQALPWIEKHTRQQVTSAERLAGARADAVEMENTKRRGELVRADDVRDICARMDADLGARLKALPDRVAGAIAGMTSAAEIRALLLTETRRIRSGFADFIGALANTPPKVSA